MFFTPAVPYVVPTKMIDVIAHLGLQSGLKLCLDASDISSYSGAGQSWLDTSGNGYDFFRGATSSSEGSDPTFNGSAGGQSSGEYWSFDGGDYFTYDTTNETWMNNLHKNNAKFALATWAFIADRDANSNGLFGTGSNNGDVGIYWLVRETANGGQLRLNVQNGSGLMLGVNGATAVSEGAWSFLAILIDEAAGSGLFQVDGSQDSISPTYSSPSSAAANYTAQIGDNGLSGPQPRPILSGGRMASFVAWEGTVPTSAQLLSLYNATKGKFGL